MVSGGGLTLDLGIYTTITPWCLGVADQRAFKPTVTSLDTGVDELVNVIL